MAPEDNFADGLGDIFDEAYNNSETHLTESLKSEEDIYSDFSLYSEGGLKRIELCYNRKTNRKVAMATLKDSTDPQKIEVFLREAKLNAALQHPNIVPVYNIGLDQEKPWFTMKFIAGQSLKEIISELHAGEKNEYADLNTRLDIFLKVCDAIAYAHSLGVIHLDIKPDNIRISKYGDVVVCDWGLADVEASNCDELLLEYCSVLDHDIENHTLIGTVKGSPGYMAPEQTTKLKMRKGCHTDIFSLGCLLYSLLTYEKPFDAASIEELLEKTAKCNFPKPSSIKRDLPFSLEAVCLKAMSLEPTDRYLSVENLQKDIFAYRNGFATNAEEASFVKGLKLLIMRHKSLSIAAVLTLTLVLILTSVFINNLELSKTNAEQLSEKLLLEKDFHEQMGVDSAPLFLQRALDTYVICSFDESLRFVNNAVSRDDTILEAWLLKGKTHFIREEFTAAYDAFIMGGLTKANKLVKLTEKYKKIKLEDHSPLSIKLYLELLADLRPLQNGDIFGKVIHYKAFGNLSLDDRIAFCTGVIKLIHGPSTTRKFVFNFDKETKHLDLSNNPWLRDSNCLQNFPAHSVDLTATPITNFIGLRGQPLKSLNISHTKIIEMHSLTNKEIKNLNISNNGIYNITPINNFPIEVIHIQNTPISNCHDLTKLSQLKELHLHHGQLSKSELDKLSPQIKIVYHPKNQL
ncbi:serine/threonine-protein kinase [Lentisphaera profundi]|uniref:Serine/threonine-protein kinase n=1 Tax=Lentisphaera profundi TaxID=1658616 RepID=A0ABY7W2N1_9BACT|nr:serine/threonine-protein kinase [Lentisphaera profundi]WDE99372.1 serine/threonine-protein kinase [Lentisphaera profundi]